MRIAVGVLYGFDSPFLVCLLDTYTFLLATIIISLSIPLNRRTSQCTLEERECLERVRARDIEWTTGLITYTMNWNQRYAVILNVVHVAMTEYVRKIAR